MDLSVTGYDSERVKLIDQLIKSNIDLIPIDNWGFDEVIKEKIRNRKHRIVNSRLTEGEKQRLSKAAKQLLARELGGSFQTITEVFRWLHHSSFDIKPKKMLKSVSGEDLARPNVTVVEDRDEEELENGSKNVVKRLRALPKVEGSKERDDFYENPSSSIETQASSIAAGTVGELGSKENVGPSEKARFGTGKRKNKDQIKLDLKRPRCGTESIETSNENKTDVKLTDLPVLTNRSLAMQKLQAKIEQLKAARRGKKPPQFYEDVKKAKRKLSKLKLKEKRRKCKQQNGKVQREQEETRKTSTENDLGVPNNLTKSDAKIVYSKFDFLVKEEPEKPSKKDKRDKFTGKDYKRLLEKAEKRAEKIEKIREKHPEKAQRIEENILWNKALSRAEGQKVKDNPLLLKKGLRKKEKMKERRKRKWDERVEVVRRKQEQRQEKRRENIQARKESKKKKKIGKARKKGRIV